MEIRTDARKTLFHMRRPRYRGAQGIGNWFKVMTFISYLSVFTNIYTLAFTSDALQGMVPDNRLVWVALLLEHIIIAVKVLAAELIPDIPRKVLRSKAREHVLRDVHARQQRVVEHFARTRGGDRRTDPASMGSVGGVSDPVRYEPGRPPLAHTSSLL